MHRDLETGLLYRVIDIYDDKQKRLAMCRHALILPDGTLSLVSIEEVIASELSMPDKVDIENISVFAKANRIIPTQGVNECDDLSLTNDTVNHLKAIHELNDDFLTSFCFSVCGGETDLRLPKTHKQSSDSFSGS